MQLPHASSQATPRSKGDAPAVDPRDLVAHLFGSLDRAVRTWRLYGGAGPLVDRQVADLLAAATAAVATGEVTVRVAAFGLVWNGEPIGHEDRRTSWLFTLFGDGVREITILPRVGVAELRAWVGLLAEDALRPDEDSVLRHWNADLPHIRLYAVDVFDDGGLTELDGPTALTATDPVPVRLGATGRRLLLAPDDLRLLRARDRLRWVADTTMPARRRADGAPPAGRLTTRDHARFVAFATRTQVRDGMSTASPMVVDHFDGALHEGDLDAVADLLQVAADLPDPAGGPLLAALLDEPRLPRAAMLFEAHPARLLPALAAVVRRLPDRVVALATLISAAGPRALLERALVDAGADLTPYLTPRLQDPDPAVVRHACVELGRIGTPAALRELATVLRHPVGSVREASLRAMAGRYNPEARVDLARALHDPDPLLRGLCLGVVRGSGDLRLAWAILSAVQDPAFDGFEPAEQELFYRTLGAFRDPRVVPHAARWLTDKNLLRARPTVRRQLLCISAIAEGPTRDGLALLREQANAWYLPREVKEAVAAAILRGGAA